MAKKRLNAPNVFKQLRQQRGMSLQDAGALMGKDRSYVYAVESGKVQKPIEYANLFTKAMKLSIAEKKLLRKAILIDIEGLLGF